MNNRFLNEAKMLDKKWAESGLLDDLGDRRYVTAKMMECQRLKNEISTDVDDVKIFYRKDVDVGT